MALIYLVYKNIYSVMGPGSKFSYYTVILEFQVIQHLKTSQNKYQLISQFITYWRKFSCLLSCLLIGFMLPAMYSSFSFISNLFFLLFPCTMGSEKESAPKSRTNANLLVELLQFSWDFAARALLSVNNDVLEM